MSDQTPQNHPNDQAAGHDGLPGVYLVPPWATYADDSNAYRAHQQHAHPGRLKQQAETERKFIEDRSRVHATYIQEVEKTP